VAPVFGRLGNRKEVAADLPDVLCSLQRNRMLVNHEYRISLDAYKIIAPGSGYAFLIRIRIRESQINADPDPSFNNGHEKTQTNRHCHKRFVLKYVFLILIGIDDRKL
jgi:hypothetical protein